MSTPLAEADALLERIHELLVGRSPEVIGVVVDELTALFIASYRCPCPREEAQSHASLIDMHTKHVRDLVAMYIGGTAWQ